MRVWTFHDPGDLTFAQAGRRGTWTPPGTDPRIQPLVIEWQPGSDVIGDFTWAGFDSDIVVTESVGQALLQRFRGFELGPVEMVQNPRLRRPVRITRRTKPRVWLPYEGPPLYELWVTASAHADTERSTLRLDDVDPSTGEARYAIVGGEHAEWRGVFPNIIERRVRRRPGKGVYLREQDLQGAGIFHVEQLSGWTFCTDPVRQFILESGFTNVDFYEKGETF